MTDRMNARPIDAPAPSDCRSLVAALTKVLDELRVVVSCLDAPEYVLKSGPLFAGASVGGHVRHCLDHARALVDAGGPGPVEYDRRERGTNIETDPDAAIAEFGRLLVGLERLVERPADASLIVSIMPTRESTPVSVRSTLGRELAFVLSHTIHHNATVRGMLVASGRLLPESFGFAPSTLAHQDRLTQAAGER